MPRVRKGAARAQARKRLLRKARGYYGTNHLHKYRAENAVIRAGCYAYRDRRNRKRNFRSLWITRVNAAARLSGLNYSNFIHGLKKANVQIDRKVLAHLAVHDLATFSKLADLAKAQVG